MINIAEILKNAPQGLKLYSLVHGEVTLDDVSNENSKEDYSISVNTQSNDWETFTKYGEMYSDYKDAECILFPSKEHKSWNNWQDILFQIGDIVTNNITHRSFIITNYNTHELIDRQGSTCHNKFVDYEYATPEERDQFFKELNTNGYTWNDNTKQMEKSLQTNSCGCINAKTKERSFTIDSFKTFDKVLCRCKGEYWGIEFFERYDDGKYYCLSCRADYCIPYNDETKHLIGTDDDCPDKYKTW